MSNNRLRNWIGAIVLAVMLITLFTANVYAATPVPTPDALEQTQSLIQTLLGSDNATTVQIVLLMTILSLAPSILIMLTAFTRIIIVLGFTRNAMGTMTMPPNQVLIGLALFLTFFVMAPVLSQIGEEAYTPLVNQEITQEEAVDRAMEPLANYMRRQVYDSDLRFFISVSDVDLTEVEPDAVIDEVPMHVLIPAYITSEIKHAFEIGFMIYIPFIVIDMVVASTLLSMGMMMLPPSMISLPFKVLLFILVDGWQMTIGALLHSFN